MGGLTIDIVVILLRVAIFTIEQNKLHLQTEQNKLYLQTEQNKLHLQTEHNKLHLQTEHSMLHLQTEHSKLHLEYKKLHLQTEQNSYIAEEFEDSNAEIRSRISKKDRQYNCQHKRYKQ